MAIGSYRNYGQDQQIVSQLKLCTTCPVIPVMNAVLLFSRVLSAFVVLGLFGAGGTGPSAISSYSSLESRVGSAGATRVIAVKFRILLCKCSTVYTHRCYTASRPSHVRLHVASKEKPNHAKETEGK